MNNDNRNSSHNHHGYDDMEVKHEHGITDEHGDHKDKYQEHHAGHDHSGTVGMIDNGHDHSEHNRA